MFFYVFNEKYDIISNEKKDSKFPIIQEDIDIINKFIISGESEELVCHEWTKLYYHRLFDEPNSQIEYIKKE